MNEKCDAWVNTVKDYITKIAGGSEVIQRLSFTCSEHGLTIRVEEYIQRDTFTRLIGHLSAAGAAYYRGGLFHFTADALDLLEKLGKRTVETPPPITVYFDGLCEPVNPGGVAAYAFLVYQGESKLYEKWGIIGEGAVMSDIVAEYYAVCEALAWLLHHGHHNAEITVRGDSQLVVNQLNRRWGTQDELYYKYYIKTKKYHDLFTHINWYLRLKIRIKKYLDIFTDVKFEWVPRERNKEAHELARRAYEDYCHAMGRPVEYMEEKWGGGHTVSERGNGEKYIEEQKGK